MKTNTNTSPEPFIFNFPIHVKIEWEMAQSIAETLGALYTRVVIVYKNEELTKESHLNHLKLCLEKVNIKTILYNDFPEKITSNEIDSLAYFLKKSKTELVIAFGARETLAAVRTAALLTTNNLFSDELAEKSKMDFLPPLPFVNIPTYPIMGEEYSSYWWVRHFENKKTEFAKLDSLYPKYTYVDYSFLTDLSSSEVARLSLAIFSISMDAMNSKKSNALVETLGIETVNLIIQNLTIYLKNNQDKNALKNLCLASFYAGLACSITGYGLVFGIAYNLFELYKCDFNMLVSTILPHIMEYNLTVKSELYVKIAHALGEDISDLSVIEAAIHTIETVRKLFLDLKVPKRLSEFNFTETQVLEISKGILDTEFIKNNSRTMDQESLEHLLHISY